MKKNTQILVLLGISLLCGCEQKLEAEKSCVQINGFQSGAVNILAYIFPLAGESPPDSVEFMFSDHSVKSATLRVTGSNWTNVELPANTPGIKFIYQENEFELSAEEFSGEIVTGTGAYVFYITINTQEKPSVLVKAWLSDSSIECIDVLDY